jgi:alpha,alpha-trehalase
MTDLLSFMKSNSPTPLKYIKKAWSKPLYFPRTMKKTIGLPKPFISPNRKAFDRDQFYWDSYFIILGLVRLGKTGVAKGMVENLAYLYSKFGIIPSRNRYYNLGISQPPFLTSMAFEVYNETGDKKWLKKIMLTAEKELKEYWKERESPDHHLVTLNLSRYCDHYVTHETAEQESGWDLTSRFKHACMNYLPADLNSCLYRYETDLERAFTILKDEKKAKKYAKLSKKRKKEMNELLWSERRGFYFDYNYVKQKRSKFYSLAGFYPMWAGLAEREMAKKMVKKLRLFESRYGLANTQKTGLSKEYRQWDYPNGWPNQQWIVAEGLKNYGYAEDAKRIAEKWLALNTKVFLETGKMWEKYDVVSGEIGKSGRYETQSGFGWTNGVFVAFLKDY